MSYDEAKYNAFEAKMHEKYPEMFSQPYGGFAIGEGWWPILESLCGSIQYYINWMNRESVVVPQVYVQQIKEKFGGLRFYYDGGDERIRGMVQIAEDWAQHSCEECGKPGIQRTGGWIKILCDEHEVQRQERMKQRQ